MVMEEIWTEFLGALAFTVVMALVIAAIDRGCRRACAMQPYVLRPPRITFVIGVVCCLVMFVPTAISLFLPAAPLFVTLVFGILSLPGLWIMLSGWRTRFEIGPTGILVQTVFIRQTWLSWDDVTKVHWAMFRQAFVLQTRKLGNISVDAGLCGLPVFARQVLTSVTEDRIDANAKELLANTAKGILPELRGG